MHQLECWGQKKKYLRRNEDLVTLFELVVPSSFGIISPKGKDKDHDTSNQILRELAISEDLHCNFITFEEVEEIIGSHSCVHLAICIHIGIMDRDQVLKIHMPVCV